MGRQSMGVNPQLLLGKTFQHVVECGSDHSQRCFAGIGLLAARSGRSGRTDDDRRQALAETKLTSVHPGPSTCLSLD